MAARDGEAEVPAPSGTVTFLFSDIEGSTQRWDRDRVAMQEAVRAHDRLMREAIAARAGRVFKTVGDAFCAAFATPESAAGAALDAQRALGGFDFSAVDGVRVRMAINTGTADERDGDYFGPTLNRVARLLSLAYGGQVLLSGIAADLVRENPPPESVLDDLGAHTLKDLERPEHVYQLVAAGLQRDFPALRAPVERPWLVPAAMHTRYFTGREGLLADLRRQLQERRRAALSGLGGAGKTQTALAYALRHRTDYRDGVFWCNAETAGGLTSGFVDIAAALRLPVRDESDHERIVRATLDWLTANDRWLLILDNVSDRRLIDRFAPDRAAGDVLVTSRERVFAEAGMPRALDVGDLNEDEAVAFLLARTGRRDPQRAERAAASALAAELGYLPLALEQAAAYIAETDAAFGDYLEAFRKRRLTLLERSSALVARDTVAVTWAANFEAVERASPQAADLFRLSAFVAPDAITYDLFAKGAQAAGGAVASALADADALSMAELLRPLARYSLVRTDAASHAFGVHRLVAEIVRDALDDDERRGYVERAAAALEAAFPSAEYATWPACDRLVPHVMAVAGWVEAYDVATEAAGGIFQRSGSYLRERGRYAEARALHERSLALRERVLGKDHLDVASSLTRLAIVQVDQGEHVLAEPLLKRAVEIEERALGPDHLQLAISLNTLATVYSEQGRYEEAERLFERVLSIRERSLGPDHADVAASLNNLAYLYADRGRLADAEPLLERGLAIRERALGGDHPRVANSLTNLAHVYFARGRFAEAEALHERALAIREHSHGRDHPLIAHSLDGIAEVRRKRGRHDEAQPLNERALRIRERALGPGHQLLSYSLDGLAAIARERGRYAEARTLAERSLRIRQDALGSGHPNLAYSLEALADVQLELGEQAEAESAYRRSLELREAALGGDHPLVAVSLGRLAGAYMRLGRDADAVPLLERAIAICEREFVPGHGDVAQMRDDLARVRSEAR